MKRSSAFMSVLLPPFRFTSIGWISSSTCWFHWLQCSSWTWPCTKISRSSGPITTTVKFRQQSPQAGPRSVQTLSQPQTTTTAGCLQRTLCPDRPLPRSVPDNPCCQPTGWPATLWMSILWTQPCNCQPGLRVHWPSIKNVNEMSGTLGPPLSWWSCFLSATHPDWSLTLQRSLSTTKTCLQ